LVTNDIAELRDDGCFRIKGRKDNVICSGGLKIQIEEVERLLKPHLDGEYMITKRKDERLGEALVLLTEQADAESLRPLCQQVLGRYEVPRHYLHVAKVPLTPTGKPARRDAFLLASDLLP
jgi:O-succinylbenzoic acid--CoA ligase